MTGGMMFKGTQGPWRFEEYQDAISETSVRVVGANGEIVCDSEPYYAHALDPKNGPLIASSPELLGALVDFTSLYPTDIHYDKDSLVGRARAAIAKALGEQK